MGSTGNWRGTTAELHNGPWKRNARKEEAEEECPWFLTGVDHPSMFIFGWRFIRECPMTVFWWDVMPAIYRQTKWAGSATSISIFSCVATTLFLAFIGLLVLYHTNCSECL